MAAEECTESKAVKSTKMKIFGRIVLGILIFFSVIIGVFAYLLLSKSPNFSMPKANMIEQFASMKYLQSIFRNIQKTQSPDEIVSITIPENDVNNLIKTLGSYSLLAQSTGKAPQDLNNFFQRGSVTYKDGKFNILAQTYKPIWGLTILLNTNIIVEFDNDELDLEITDMYFGKIAVPESICKEITENLETESENNPKFQIFKTVIKKIDVADDGSLVISYSPYAAKQQLQ